MDALTLLTQRKSNKKLTAPAPSQVQLEQMFQAALRAPDHGKLEPYQMCIRDRHWIRSVSCCQHR